MNRFMDLHNQIYRQPWMNYRYPIFDWWSFMYSIYENRNSVYLDPSIWIMEIYKCTMEMLIESWHNWIMSCLWVHNFPLLNYKSLCWIMEPMIQIEIQNSNTKWLYFISYMSIQDILRDWNPVGFIGLGNDIWYISIMTSVCFQQHVRRKE